MPKDTKDVLGWTIMTRTEDWTPVHFGPPWTWIGHSCRLFLFL